MNVNHSLALRGWPWAVSALTAGIFAIDLLTPLEFAVSSLYVLPLFLMLLSPHPQGLLYFSSGATVLTWVAVPLHPAGPPMLFALFHRAFVTMIIWGIAIGMAYYRRTQRDLMVERAHAEGLMTAAQEARAYADTAAMGAAAGHRETETKLQISQLRLNGIIESAMDAIVTVNEEQRVVLFNRAAEQMFGCSAQDAMGQPLTRFLPARFRDAHHSHMHAFGQGGVTNRKMGRLGTVSGVRANGEEFPIEAAISHVTTEGEKYYTVILRDITDRKRIEAQLRRTEQVAELGTLASGMAHEIGTPMNVILGRAEYLMDRVKEEPVKKGLQTIVAQVERITKVMNQLLVFARRKPPERGPLVVKDIVEGSLELFRERLTRSGVTVELALGDHCPAAQADADQMSQVMINLIMNALHAMEDGGTLRIGLGQEQDGIKLTVGDTGHGIPKDELQNIFEPFYTTKEFGKGTGLGLTVVKGIIEEHHGTITVDSEEGKGTKFTILLPKSI